MEGLRRIVADPRVLHDSWEKQPFVSTALGDFDDVFSVEAAEHLVRTSLPLASTRLFRDGAALPAKLVERPAERRGRTRTQLVDGAEIARHVLDGATLVIEELQLYNPDVAAFAAAITAETGYDTDCTAFLTPSRAGGVKPHADPVSVFLRQVHGAKRWQVWSPAREPLLDVVLTEGDCLYIPRGFRHAGETLDEPSVHLSVSVTQLTWGAVLQRMVATVAEEDVMLREALPPLFATHDRDALFRERLAVLVERLGGARPADADLGSTPRATAPADVDLVGALDRLGAGRGA